VTVRWERGGAKEIHRGGAESRRKNRGEPQMGADLEWFWDVPRRNRFQRDFFCWFSLIGSAARFFCTSSVFG
jgi:hypothetical protein